MVKKEENGSHEPAKLSDSKREVAGNANVGSTGGFRRVKDARRMVAEMRDGDGVDPKQERRDRQRSRFDTKTDHSAQRLATQMERCVNSNLGLGILSDFVVLRVSHGKGNHFLVELVCADPNLSYDPHEAQRVALELLPRIRSELAREIHRKKVPSLSIQIVSVVGSRAEYLENSQGK